MSVPSKKTFKTCLPLCCIMAMYLRPVRQGGGVLRGQGCIWGRWCDLFSSLPSREQRQWERRELWGGFVRPWHCAPGFPGSNFKHNVPMLLRCCYAALAGQRELSTLALNGRREISSLKHCLWTGAHAERPCKLNKHGWSWVRSQAYMPSIWSLYETVMCLLSLMSARYLLLMHPHVFVFKQVQSESFRHQLIIMTIINISLYPKQMVLYSTKSGSLACL